MQPQRQTVQSTAWWLTKWWWGDKRRQEWHKQELKVKYCLGINVVFSSPKLLKRHCAHCLLSLPAPHFPNSLHLISTSAATKTVFFCFFFLRFTRDSTPAFPLYCSHLPESSTLICGFFVLCYIPFKFSCFRSLSCVGLFPICRLYHYNIIHSQFERNQVDESTS